MDQPHHHAFNLLHHAIVKSIKVEDVLDHLVDRKVIKESDIPRYKGKPKNNGMKRLIELLRNRNFDTFLNFVECIFLSQGEALKMQKPIPIVESMIGAVQEYDERNPSTQPHAGMVIAIRDKYLKQPHAETEEGEQAQEKPMSSKHILHLSDLDYVEEPVQTSFQSSGGEFLDLDTEYGFSLTVPPMAVPKGQEVNLRVGLCCYGPFSMDKNFLLVSDFAVVVADTIKFSKPITVTMEHCLVRLDSIKSTEIIILKADHQNTEDGLYTFSRFTNPVLLPDATKLTFETDEFCILCAVLDLGERPGVVTPRWCDNSITSSSSQIDDDNPSSAPSSFDEPLGVERSDSTESQPPAARTPDPVGSPQKAAYNLRKRKSDNSMEGNTVPSTVAPQQRRSSARSKRMAMRRPCEHYSIANSKKHCSIEYVAVLFQDSKKVIDVRHDHYQFVIFVTTNCPVANKMCMKRAEEILSTEVETSVIPITFNGAEKALRFETTVNSKCSGWTVDAEKSPSVGLSEVQVHTMDDSDLLEKLKQKTCPPRLLFTAECDEEASKKFSCKVTIRGATTAETQDEVFFNIKATMPTSTTAIPRQNAIDSYLPAYGSQNLSSQHRNPPMPPYPFHHKQNVFSNLYPRPQPPSSYPENLSQATDLSQPQYSGAAQVDSARFQGPLGSQDLYMYRGSQSQSESGDISPKLLHSRSHPAHPQQPEFGRSISLSSDYHLDRLYISDVETEPRSLQEISALLTSEEKNAVITDTEYYANIIRHMSSWKNVARHGFDFSEPMVKQISSDHMAGGFKECAYQAYRKWKMEGGYTGPIPVWTMLEILYKAEEFEAISHLVKVVKRNTADLNDSM